MSAWVSWPIPQSCVPNSGCVLGYMRAAGCVTRPALEMNTTLSRPHGMTPNVAAAQYVLGNGGTVLMLCICFMAVTSAASAEMMAVGSLFTYDIYKVTPIGSQNPPTVLPLLGSLPYLPCPWP